VTALSRWLRRSVERALNRYDEGPDAPSRLMDMVVDFANDNPHATRAEWTAFAGAHAAECYRAGWTRGAEYVERVPELWRPDVPPEAMADALDPDWRNSPSVLDDPGAPVPEVLDERRLEELQMRRLAPR